MENQPKQYEEELEINLADYVKVVWRRKKPISAIFVGCVIVALVVSFIMPRIYQSSALLEIGKTRGNYLETQKDAISFLKQPAILQSLAQKLNMSPDDWMALNQAIKTQPDEKFLKISATANRPEKAKQIVEAVVERLTERHQKMLAQEKISIQAEVDDTKANIQAAQNRLAEIEKEFSRLKYGKTEGEGLIAQGYISTINAERANLRAFEKILLDKERELVYGSYETRVESPAVELSSPIAPSRRNNVMIAAILGLFIGIFYAFVAEYIEKNKLKFVA